MLQLQEMERPTPADNEVLIKIHATTVASEDCSFRRGRPLIARLATGLIKPRMRVLGSNLAGEIVAAGKAVKRFKPGDPVVANSDDSFGAHAEYLCLPEDGVLATKPRELSYADAVSVSAGGLTALPFLRDSGKIQPGQQILINGASGSVGSAAVQLAKHLGAQVTGVCGSKHVELVKSLGADRVIDYNRQDFTSESDSYDIIFDAVGKSSFTRCKKSLNPTGIYLSTVLTMGIVLQMLWTSKFSGKKAEIEFTGLRPAQEKLQDLNLLLQLARAGNIEPVIDRIFALEQIQDAHRYVDEGHKQGNVVIEMQPEIDN